MRPRVEAIALGHWVAIALGAMSRSSSSGEPQASSSDSEDVAPKILVKKKVHHCPKDLYECVLQSRHERHW